jgi:hypothetical protein
MVRLRCTPSAETGWLTAVIVALCGSILWPSNRLMRFTYNVECSDICLEIATMFGFTRFYKQFKQRVRRFGQGNSIYPILILVAVRAESARASALADVGPWHVTIEDVPSGYLLGRPSQISIADRAILPCFSTETRSDKNCQSNDSGLRIEMV